MMPTVAVPIGEVAGTVLDAVYRSQHRSLVRMARLLLDDVESAEEAVQDAYLKVHRRIEHAGSPDAAVPYVRAAVLNAARSRLRRRRVARAHPPVPAADAASAEERAVVAEDHREVVAAVRALPDRQRECLVLRYYLDLPDAEIARTLGISVGSVKTHIFRGTAAVAARLEGER